MEYINGTWYKISWTIDQCYEVSREDEIKDPQASGLGTKNQPFLLAPDLERIHTEVTQGSDEAPEVEITSPVSDPDIPTTDQAQRTSHRTTHTSNGSNRRSSCTTGTSSRTSTGSTTSSWRTTSEEEDNPNNHPPEDNQAGEEAAEEAVEEVAEANQQPDNKQPDKQQPHHLAANPSKE